MGLGCGFGRCGGSDCALVRACRALAPRGGLPAGAVGACGAQERLAEAAGGATPDGVQELLSRARWNAGAVRGDRRAHVAGVPPVMGAEDFSFMLEQVPGAYLNVGNGPGFLPHHPGYAFNDEAIPNGTAMYAGIVELELPGA